MRIQLPDYKTRIPILQSESMAKSLKDELIVNLTIALSIEIHQNGYCSGKPVAINVVLCNRYFRSFTNIF